MNNEKQQIILESIIKAESALSNMLNSEGFKHTPETKKFKEEISENTFSVLAELDTGIVMAAQDLNTFAFKVFK